jgi:hypothetical protein
LQRERERERESYMPTSHIRDSPHDNNLYEEVGQNPLLCHHSQHDTSANFIKKEKRKKEERKEKKRKKKKEKKERKKKKKKSTPDYTLYEIKN